LEGKAYEPIFNYFYEKFKPQGCFAV